MHNCVRIVNIYYKVNIIHRCTYKILNKLSRIKKLIQWCEIDYKSFDFVFLLVEKNKFTRQISYETLKTKIVKHE